MLLACVALLAVPSGQALHTVEYGAAAYVPGGQSSQTDDKAAPACVEYVPTGHPRQLWTDCCPGSTLNAPAGHGEHTVAAALLYVPGGQDTHASADVAAAAMPYDPDTHGIQAIAPGGA
jgi:hypothetical protein